MGMILLNNAIPLFGDHSALFISLHLPYVNTELTFRYSTKEFFQLIQSRAEGIVILAYLS